MYSKFTHTKFERSPALADASSDLWLLCGSCVEPSTPGLLVHGRVWLVPKLFHFIKLTMNNILYVLLPNLTVAPSRCPLPQQYYKWHSCHIQHQNILPQLNGRIDNNDYLLKTQLYRSASFSAAPSLVDRHSLNNRQQLPYRQTELYGNILIWIWFAQYLLRHESHWIRNSWIVLC